MQSYNFLGTYANICVKSNTILHEITLSIGCTDTPHYENVPFEIPDSWEWATIGDIAESNIGLTYDPSEICSNGVPVLRSNNIKKERIVWTDLVRVNSKIQDKQFLQEGDLLICARNGSRNLVGKCAIIEHLSEPSSFGAFMAVCRSSYNRWLYYLLQTDYFDRYLDDSNSTTINQVTQKMLLAFRIPFPPCTEQLKIETEIEKWFSIIDEIEANKQDLQEYIKQAKSKVLDLAIHGKLVPQDPNDEPAIELLKRINPNYTPCDTSHYENLPFEIPQNWVWVRGIDIFDAMQSTKPQGEFFEYIDIDAIDNKRNLIVAPKHIECSNAPSRATRLVAKGDVLFSMVRPYLRNIALVDKDDYIASTGFFVCKPNLAITSDYCFYLMTSDYVVNGLNQYMKGDNSPSINNQHILNWLYPIPPLLEQKRIVAALKKVFSQLDTITAEL